MKLHIRHGTLLCLLGLLFALPSFAQTTSGPFSLTGTDCIYVSVDGQSQAAMYVSGTWSGTIQPKASISGQAGANLQVVPSTSSTAQSTITANGLYTATVAGFQTFVLCGNTVTGTATVYFSVTQRSASGRGSSGGGAPTGPCGGDLNGTFPNCGVDQVNGAAVPASAAYLASNGGNQLVAASAPERVLFASAANTDTVACPNNTTANFATTYTIPANYLASNKLLRISLGLVAQTSGSPAQFSFKLSIGGILVYGTAGGASPGGNQTATPIRIDFLIQGPEAAGATAHVYVHPSVPWMVGSSSYTPFPGLTPQTEPVSLATNGTLIVQPILFCNTNTAGNSLTLQQFVVEALN